MAHRHKFPNWGKEESPKGISFVHFLSPPFPTEPATLGFGGDPFREVVSARTPEGLFRAFI